MLNAWVSFQPTGSPLTSNSRRPPALPDIEPDAAALGAGERLGMPAGMNVLDGTVAADHQPVRFVLPEVEGDFPNFDS